MKAPSNPFEYDPLANAVGFEDVAAKCLAAYFRKVEEARVLAGKGDATGADFTVLAAAGHLRDRQYWLYRAAQARARI